MKKKKKERVSLLQILLDKLTCYLYFSLNLNNPVPTVYCHPETASRDC